MNHITSLHLAAIQLVVVTAITILGIILLQILADSCWDWLVDKINERKIQKEKARILAGYREVARRYGRTVR